MMRKMRNLNGGPDHWWESAVFYELYVDKFAGDFRGLQKKLDYFKRLGVTALHLLPFYPSPMVDDGYDVSDYRGIRKELGDLKDFELFAKAAAKSGLRIMADLVVNHVSTEHPWFQEAIKPKKSKYRDYFLWSDTGKELSAAPNAFPHLKPSNWIFNAASGAYYFSTFYPEQADLNWDNAEILEEILKIMDFWVKRGVSGFRLDAASHLIKRENSSSKGLPETHAVLKKLRAHVDKNYPATALLAETHDSVSEIRKYFGNGDECQLVYNFPLAEAFFLKLALDDGEALQSVQRAAEIPKHCRWANFLRNHDELSLNTLTEAERRRLLESVDAAGARDFKNKMGLSMRLAGILGGDREKIINAFNLLAAAPGLPIIYYGDELGMRSLPADEQFRDTRRYVRGFFDWQEAERQMRDPDSLFHAVRLAISNR